MKKHLVQVNMARMLAPLDSPTMKEFVDFLGPINQLAEDSPGFIWRLKDEEGTSAVSIDHPFEDPMLLINMSVWEDVNSLKQFAYKTVHSYFVKNGKKWFERLEHPHFFMWWVTAGTLPTVQDAANKLNLLIASGPSTEVFTLAHFFKSNG